MQLYSCGELTLPELEVSKETRCGGGGSPRCTQLKFTHLSEGKADMNFSLRGIILSWDPVSSILGLLDLGNVSPFQYTRDLLSTLQLLLILLYQNQYFRISCELSSSHQSDYQCAMTAWRRET